MLAALRRAALMAACQHRSAAVAAAAAAVGSRSAAPPAAASAAAWLQLRGFSAPAEPELVPASELHPQPFSKALQQLEASVTEGVLPADALAANRAAMATVKEFAKSLESRAGYPPAAVKNVVFVFRDPFSGGRLQRVRCQLKTTGGDCRELVRESLGALLRRMGLNPLFFYDGSQFRPRALPRAPPRVLSKPPSQQLRPGGEPTVAEVEAVRARAAAAGFPSQTISEEQFKAMEAQSAAAREAKAAADAEADAAAEQLKRMDPLLAAVAAVPWIAVMQEEGQKTRLQIIRTQVLDEIEAWGWDVRGAAHRIWRGERDAEALLAGKDSGSANAIKAILFHATANDRKYGGKQTFRG